MARPKGSKNKIKLSIVAWKEGESICIKIKEVKYMKIKKWLVGLFLLLFACPAFAGPFIVCDPYPSTAIQPTEFVLVIDGGSPVTSPAVNVVGGVGLRHDLMGIAAGAHNVTVKAVKVDPVWGRLESANIPFMFVRPVNPTAPVNISLTP